MKAKRNIPSLFNPKEVYASAGEKLKLIKNRDGVLIVENEEGKCFAALPEEVTDYDFEITLDDAPAAASTKINKQNGVGSKSKKATPINQQTLFHF